LSCLRGVERETWARSARRRRRLQGGGTKKLKRHVSRRAFGEWRMAVGERVERVQNKIALFVGPC
jgi:hypothetical protein